MRADIQQALDGLAKAGPAIDALVAKTGSDATAAAEAEVAPDIATLNDAISAFLTKYGAAGQAPADQG